MTLMISEYFNRGCSIKSIDHWAEALDTVGTSDEFQALVAKASEFGMLSSAFMMVPL